MARRKRHIVLFIAFVLAMPIWLRVWYSRADRIDPGMTKAELVRLMGSPATIYTAPDGHELWFYLPLPFINRLLSSNVSELGGPMKYYMNLGVLISPDDVIFATVVQGESASTKTLNGLVPGDDLVTYTLKKKYLDGSS